MRRLVPSHATAELTTGADGVTVLPLLSTTVGNADVGATSVAAGQDTVEPPVVDGMLKSNLSIV